MAANVKLLHHESGGLVAMVGSTIAYGVMNIEVDAASGVIAVMLSTKDVEFGELGQYLAQVSEVKQITKEDNVVDFKKFRAAQADSDSGGDNTA